MTHNKMTGSMMRFMSILLCVASLATHSLAQEIMPGPEEASYSPSADRSYPQNVYWGDTHVHTNLSIDAYSWDGLSPDAAYRFARGESVKAKNGLTAKLDRPLDFLVVADHAASLGFLKGLELEDPALMKFEYGRTLSKELQSNPKLWEKLIFQDKGFDVAFMWRDVEFRESAWRQVIDNAEAYNLPGKFTAFVGYEWTPGAPPSNYEHRVIVYRDGPDKTGMTLPFSTLDSFNPKDLWLYLENYSANTGGEALAIAHNGNLSKGKMFLPEKQSGEPYDISDASLRSRWEPLYEVIQIKGASETHPVLSPADEFADYEIWDLPIHATNTFDTEKLRMFLTPANFKQYEYARSALKLGLAKQRALGINPFKFGLIGSSDSHTSLAGSEDRNFWGTSYALPAPDRAISAYFPDKPMSVFKWQLSSAGYAGVWATENTREALFDAMKRREVYASTGPRLKVRFFGGWDYDEVDAFRPDLARIGYEGGVPMGGDMTAAPHGKAPRFLIRAVKDPDGANLDRVQVIKGWHSEDGELHEKVYDVALSDERKRNWRGTVKPVGNTVDVEDASYTNTIGDPELAVVWEDPDFDADELAFYYVRVLEIPTPRWTAYDAKLFNIPLEAIPGDVPMVTQERAYSSPIWYEP